VLLGSALLASIGTSASAAPIPSLRGHEQAPWSRMRKAEPTQKWSNPNSTAGLRQKKVSSNFTSPASDVFEYLTAPDGTIWYAVTHYDTEEIKHEYYTEHKKKGFTMTFYDNKFNEIGKVRDKIELQEGETACAQISLSSQITQKYFNYDSNYEVMVSYFMNTPEYVTKSRTVGYAITQLGDDEFSVPIATIPGYPVDEVNCARDRWSEEFYFTFLVEESGNPDDYDNLIDYLGTNWQILTTYGKYLNQVMEKKIRLLDLPGDQMTSPMLVCNNVDGHLVITYAQYEKSFFENPAGESDNENVTADNHLIIETYRMNDAYPSEMELLSTTKIETVQHTENPDVYCTFYGIGNLMWEKDVDFEHYTSDGRPAYIVSVDDCLYRDDEHYTSGYYVYDADGNRIRTIAENTYDFVKMSDISGFEPQVMFIHMGDDMNFEFVDLYSCMTVTTIDQMFKGYALTTSLDRVVDGDSYIYATALSAGIPLDDTHLAAPVCWFDSNGDFVRLDLIPTGEGVELAQIYMAAAGLQPFTFNTDNNIEYMLLVKRNIPGQAALREELLIASTEKGVLHTFTDDEVKGAIRSVMLMPGSNPELLLVYLNENDKYTADAFPLPFSKFVGGSGTESDPYLIASAGDLQQIKTNPAAFYKITEDIDCGSLDLYPINEFSGTLDGAGHTLSNLKIISKQNNKNGIFNFTNKATIKNIEFYNAKMTLSGSSEAALVAATASNTKFENIRVHRLSATGDNFSNTFGGIAGKAWVSTSFSGCEIAGADVNLPSCDCAGGIVGDIRTGTSITGCAVSGNITVNSTLGGIVGSTTTGDEVISQCHVDANLKAENTVGGIAGYLNRSKVTSNYVEGALEATKPSKWNHSISLGAIAGELEGDYQGKGDMPITQNLVGVSALIYPSLEGIEVDDPRQLATVHRIVGRTSYNQYMEEEPSKIIYENGVYNNYVVSDIAVIDPEFDERSLEGKSMDKDEVDTDWLKNQLGFLFGKINIAPWNIQSWYAYDPSLYYESIAYIPNKQITVDKGEAFDIEIAVLSREALTEEEIIDGFMCEFDESVLEMTGNMSYDGKTLKVGMTAIKEGDSKVSVSIAGNRAECLVKGIGGNAVDGIVATGGKPTVSSGVVTAEGCAITIYDLNGRAMLSGRDKVDATSLVAGVYVAVATDNGGRTTAVKFAK
ncbi:MAG: hypothetical protein K2N25_07785, partial [Muribaculaceae bacterium]|nr:hypothetical protein [Muribaculaceae bacterium]